VADPVANRVFVLTASTLRIEPHCLGSGLEGKHQVVILKKQDDVSTGGMTTTSTVDPGAKRLCTTSPSWRLQRVGKIRIRADHQNASNRAFEQRPTRPPRPQATGAGTGTSCKPSSVRGGPRPDPRRSCLWGRRCRRPPARHPPGPADHGCDGEPSLRAACACTRWGLPCPVRHRNGRCALTAPFHPCLRPRSHRRSVLCGTFPDPQSTGRWVLPTTVILSCSDFPRLRLRGDAIARSPPRL
jgi:hypothetical protein